MTILIPWQSQSLTYVGFKLAVRVVSSGEAAAQENGEDHDFKVDHFDSDVDHKSRIG